MDPATIIGFVLAIVGIEAATIMEGGSPTAIILPAPMVLVIVGTIGAALAGSRMPDIGIIIQALIGGLKGKKIDASATIDVIVSLAEKARREGLLALEDAAKEVDDQFLKDGLQAAIDGADPEDLRQMLHDKIDTKRATDKIGYAFFATAGGFAPTVGIVGTVTSLVHVLSNLGEPATLGAEIASALVATFWGLLTANVFLLPLSGRLKRLSESECAQMELIVEGLMAVQAGANPRLVGQRLRSLVPETKAKAAA